MTRQKHLGKINANFRYLHISILQISQIFVIIVHVSCHNITKFFNRRHWRQKRNHKKRSKVKAGCFHPVYPPSEDLGDNKCFLLQQLSHVTNVTIFGSFCQRRGSEVIVYNIYQINRIRIQILQSRENKTQIQILPSRIRLNPEVFTGSFQNTRNRSDSDAQLKFSSLQTENSSIFGK